MKYQYLIVLFILLFIDLNAQNSCEGKCLGKPTWKNERTIVDVEMDTENPYNSIFKINVKRWYNSGYYGTASFINDSTIITAHHNLIRKAHITKVSYLINGHNVELKRKDFNIYYFKKKQRTNSDIAIIKIKNRTKIHRINTQFEIKENAYKNTDKEIHLTGFPCDYNGDEKIDKQAPKIKLKIDSCGKLIGYPMYTCTGDSGAPLWFNENGKFYLIGVHHGGNAGHSDYKNTEYNISVYFNKEVIEWIFSIIYLNKDT